MPDYFLGAKYHLAWGADAVVTLLEEFELRCLEKRDNLLPLTVEEPLILFHGAVTSLELGRCK